MSVKKQVAEVSLDTVSAAYVATREELSNLSKREKELKAVQEKREEWLCQELQKQKLKSVKTSAGTIFQTLKESVTVGEWDTFVKEAILRPAAEAMVVFMSEDLKREGAVETVLDILESASKIELLNHAVSKTEVLAIMGEERDQPAPAGINYTAKRTVGIRKS